MRDRCRTTTHITSHASEFSEPLFEKFGFVVNEIEHTSGNGVKSRYEFSALPHQGQNVIDSAIGPSQR